MVSFGKARVRVVFLVERAAIIDSQSIAISGRACRSTSRLHSSTTRPQAPALVHRLCMSAFIVCMSLSSSCFRLQCHN
jgi:hypothetical protein